MWSIELKQQVGIVRLLLQHLVNPAVPLQSHYGEAMFSSAHSCLPIETNQ